MGDGTKQVRVDNWGIFFLQRLQVFFSKTDYCDMTLQFEGNVQLKVHRLVMNACTEYFSFLEQTCGTDDNVIMMPADLQADVIVPIVNFMYTGMLEFHLSIFDRLYRTAQAMNITILTKLLDAQKQSANAGGRSKKKQLQEPPSPHFNLQAPKKNATPKPSPMADLPATLPGRKLPIWKRKSIPGSSSSSSQPFVHSSSFFSNTESKWSSSAPSDPLSLDNTPKPTRFEWPDDDLPAINPMDTSFEEISYTSKPLLTQEEENRSSSCFDDLKQTPNSKGASSGGLKRKSNALDMEEMKNYVKEQKIRSGLQDEEDVDNDFDNSNDSSQSGQKRRAASDAKRTSIKRVRFENDQDGKGPTTISIATDGKSGADVDHNKIVSEILKKYPQLVKKNKNIRLKIMTKGSKGGAEQAAKADLQNKTSLRTKKEVVSPRVLKEQDPDSNSPWVCERCSTEDEPMEFVLYYLYRKHMTDVHSEKFDSRLCKYCGHRCNKHNLMMYHLYTKHAMKPPPAYSFPKCNLCPYIALSANILNRHKLRHNKNEIQCVECKLAFSSRATLNTHLQITGHNGKHTGKSNYDCQYCTKRFTSAPNLFSHVKSQHRNEARRDGIVSIDEEDEMDDSDDQDDTGKEEYILPEIISDPEPQPKKVNILSDVKVPNQQVHHLPLEPSSEAEALTNVATGIATSLGLVDIVVLNENQQFLLQPEQQGFGGGQHQRHHHHHHHHEQTEFILPELTGGETAHHFTTHGQNEVLTTSDGSVITQSMLSGGDIGSTDELVMVLTDHDYGDGNQEDVNNDNSNIVVLYSHPVDGQQDQFITTTQGNIMVNSQTGMFEIRNGATMTATSANTVEIVQQQPQQQQPQPVPEVSDAPIESIEMIQREIESHGSAELKQEATYDDEPRPLVPVTEPAAPNPDDDGDEDTCVTDHLEIPEENLTERVEESQQEEPRELEEPPPPPPCDEAPDVPEQEAEQVQPSLVPPNEDPSFDNNDSSLVPNDPALVPDDSSLDSSLVPCAEQEKEASEARLDESTETYEAPIEEADHNEEEPHDDAAQNEPAQPGQIPEEPVPDDQSHSQDQVPPEEGEEEVEESQPTPQDETQKLDDTIDNSEALNESAESTAQLRETLEDEPAEESTEEPEEAKDKDDQKEESQDLSEISTSQDDNSQSSRDSSSGLQEATAPSVSELAAAATAPAQKKTEHRTPTIPHSILDDWGDDTDSQQSGQQQQQQQSAPPVSKEAVKVAGETVDKLMDDWEEEEEESETNKKESDE